jgi:hypothetical protein
MGAWLELVRSSRIQHRESARDAGIAELLPRKPTIDRIRMDIVSAVPNGMGCDDARGDSIFSTRYPLRLSSSSSLKARSMSFHSYATTRTLSFSNSRRKPFDDGRVRRALKLCNSAVDTLHMSECAQQSEGKSSAVLSGPLHWAFDSYCSEPTRTTLLAPLHYSTLRKLLPFERTPKPMAPGRIHFTAWFPQTLLCGNGWR